MSFVVVLMFYFGANFIFAENSIDWQHKDIVSKKNFFNLHSKLNGFGDVLYFCKNGQMIFKSKICDGTIDCRDKSDETLNICGEKKCGKNEFRCSYGACINNDIICDDKFDCADGSDEIMAFCSSSKMCIMPKNTVTTIYFIPGCDDCKFGSLVEENTQLLYQCTNQNYQKQFESEQKIFCKYAQWMPNIPICTNESIGSYFQMDNTTTMLLLNVLKPLGETFANVIKNAIILSGNQTTTANLIAANSNANITTAQNFTSTLTDENKNITQDLIISDKNDDVILATTQEPKPLDLPPMATKENMKKLM